MFVEDRVSHACNYLKQSLAMFFYNKKQLLKPKKEFQGVHCPVYEPDLKQFQIRIQLRSGFAIQIRIQKGQKLVPEKENKRNFFKELDFFWRAGGFYCTARKSFLKVYIEIFSENHFKKNSTKFLLFWSESVLNTLYSIYRQSRQ